MDQYPADELTPLPNWDFSRFELWNAFCRRYQSQRRIASKLGINHETVRHYLRLANAAISTAGSEEGADRKPTISITGKQAAEAQSKPAISITGVGAT